MDDGKHGMHRKKSGKVSFSSSPEVLQSSGWEKLCRGIHSDFLQRELDEGIRFYKTKLWTKKVTGKSRFHTLTPTWAS